MLETFLNALLHQQESAQSGGEHENLFVSTCCLFFFVVFKNVWNYVQLCYSFKGA